MSPEDGRAFMRHQVEAYVAAIQRKRLNASAVYRLLEGDANFAGDAGYIRAALWEYGQRLFDARYVEPVNADPGRSHQREDHRFP